MSPPRFLTAAPHVRAVAFADATLVLDLRTGALQALTGDTARVWTAFAATGDTRTPVPGAAPGTVDRAARALIGRGLLIGAAAPRPWPPPASGQESRPSWGTRDSPAALPRSQAPPRPGICPRCWPFWPSSPCATPERGEAASPACADSPPAPPERGGGPIWKPPRPLSARCGELDASSPRAWHVWRSQRQPC